jgi:hypothetical protein
VLAQRALLVRSNEAAWRALFDRADTVSEGDARAETEGRVWYGSTSLILALAPGEDPALLAELAERNAHVRLRAVRAAHREASLRAPGRLGRLMCEIHVRSTSEGVRIDVDVQAPLIERRAVPRRSPG